MFDHCEDFIVDTLHQLWTQEGKPARVHAFQIAVLLDAKLFAHKLDERDKYDRRYELLHNKVRHLLDAGMPVDRMQRQGTWPSLNTMYLNHAMAAKIWQQVFVDSGDCKHPRALRFGELGWEEEQKYSTFGGDAEECFRRSHLWKLEKHYKAARSELRFGVMSTIGTCFTAELAEMVFEQTLDVEGIPRDSRVFEKNEHEGDKGDCPWMPRLDEQPRIEYDCGY